MARRLSRISRALPSLLTAFAACAGLFSAGLARGADQADVKVKSSGGQAPVTDQLAPSDADGKKTTDRLIPPASPGRKTAVKLPLPAEWRENDDVFGLRRRFEKPRSAFWIPFLTFWVPGLDQWWEGQYASAAFWTGASFAGYGYIDYTKYHSGLYEQERLDREAKKNGDPTQKPTDQGLDSKDVLTRKLTLAGQIAQWSGGMSAYQSFRTAVRSRRENLGEYAFLAKEETPLQIMAAPFHVQYLARPTTFIPLAIIGALSYLQVHSPVPDDADVVRDHLSGADYFFAGAFSYNAGTHEEAMFRGWIQPWLREQWSSDFWANATQSVLFAAAHLNNVQVPVIQLALGYHLGWVSQRNGYSISEGVFIHAWWDVIAFVTAYNYKPKPKDDTGAFLKPILWLPPLELNF